MNEYFGTDFDAVSPSSVVLRQPHKRGRVMLDEHQHVGIFPITYQSQQEAAGKPILKLNLLVDTAGNQLAGVGQVFESANPPVTVLSNVSGDWSFMANSQSPRILLVAEGHESIQLPSYEAFPCGLNLLLRASLAADWRTGVINFEYLSNGCWHKVIGSKLALQAVSQGAC